MAESEPSKIVVDSDWKAQAQAEKERLAAKEREAAAARAKAGPPGAGPGQAQGPEAEGGPEEMPPADFNTLLSTMVSQALHALGAFPDPQTGRALIALDLARLYIDLLAVLEEKTKGNLTEEESQYLTQALSELRLRYVEMTKLVATELAKQRAGAAGGAGGPGAGGLGGAGGLRGPGGGPDLRIGG